MSDKPAKLARPARRRRPVLYYTLKGIEGIVNNARMRNLKRSHFKVQKGLGLMAGVFAGKVVRSSWWVIFKLNDRHFWGPCETREQAETLADNIFAAMKRRQAAD